MVNNTFPAPAQIIGYGLRDGPAWPGRGDNVCSSKTAHDETQGEDMACDICGKGGVYLEPLREEYQTEEIKDLSDAP